MPTIEELGTKYATPQDFEGRMRMLSPEDQQLIKADIAKNGNPDPQIQSSYNVPEPFVARVDPQAAMTAMLQRLNSQTSPYAEQMQEALAERKRSLEAFNSAIDEAAKQKETGPSQAELYFRLAAAFGAPAKGGFFENLGKAGEVAADYRKEQRTADSSSRMNQLKLLLEKQKMAVQNADTDLASLRAMALEESKDKRALQTKLLEQFFASGKPQSEAGKFAADQGFQPGTPEFAKAAQKYFDSKLESGEWYKQVLATVAAGNLSLQQQKAAAEAESKKKLTPAEVKLKTETEDAIAANASAYEALDKALKLNPNTFDNSVPDKTQRFFLERAGSTDEKLLNTRQQENLLGNQALNQLKAVFGSAPTEGERDILLSLQGIGAKSVKERELIIKDAKAAVKQRYKREKKRLEEIMSGSYRDTKPIDLDSE